MKIFISPTRRVICESVIQLPLSSGAAWGQLRDFRSSATHDPFHAQITIEGNVPRAGARLLIEHRYLLKKSVRSGRILWWKEGEGFAFSDLCESDPLVGFPHVLGYRVEEISKEACQLRIKLGGKWTAPGPLWAGKLWLWWVFGHVVRSVENQLLGYCVGMKRKR